MNYLQRREQNNENLMSKLLACYTPIQKIDLSNLELPKYQNNIPKLIHYILTSQTISLMEYESISQCIEVNKDMLFFIWTPESSKSVIMNFFPEVKNLFIQPLTGIINMQHYFNYFKYLVLLYYGGVYLHPSSKCMKPIRLMSNFNFSCLFSLDDEANSKIIYNLPYRINPHFIACIADHTLMKMILFDYKQMYKNSMDHKNLLTNFYIKYSSWLLKSKQLNPLIKIEFASINWILTDTDEDLNTKCTMNHNKMSIKMCHSLKHHIKEKNMKILSQPYVRLVSIVNENDPENIPERDICDLIINKNKLIIF